MSPNEGVATVPASPNGKDVPVGLSEVDDVWRQGFYLSSLKEKGTASVPVKETKHYLGFPECGFLVIQSQDKWIQMIWRNVIIELPWVSVSGKYSSCA